MSSATTAPATSQQSKSRVPSSLVAFPSVSQSLYSLTSATSVHGVSLHPSSFSQQSEAKLEVALSKNLAVAKQRQQEEQENRLREMKDAARLRMLEQQKAQQQYQVVSEPNSSPITMKPRKSKAN